MIEDIGVAPETVLQYLSHLPGGQEAALAGLAPHTLNRLKRAIKNTHGPP